MDDADRPNHRAVPLRRQLTPTYGSILGADLCLSRKVCNAFDTASLLIALYRVSTIPAHYVRGTVRVPIAQAQTWLGVDNPDAALAALVGGQIPAFFVKDAAGTVTDIQLKHVWVSAFVDYVPSRGEVERQGDQYIPLDASFKMVDAGGSIVPEEYAILVGTLPYFRPGDKPFEKKRGIVYIEDGWWNPKTGRWSIDHIDLWNGNSMQGGSRSSFSKGSRILFWRMI